MWRFEKETIHVEGLRVNCIVGVHPHEREREQALVISLAFPFDFSAAAQGEVLDATLDYSAVTREAAAFVQQGRFQLLETLARGLGTRLCERFDLPSIRLHVRKPGALADADGAAVSLTVVRQDGGEP